jgi:hypothetical protein
MGIYTAFLKPAFQLPPKYALFLGGWLYLCSHKNAPLPGTREIDLEEWVATPTEYQLNPTNHPTLFGRAPNESKVADERAALYAKHGRVDGAAPAGHGHH